MVKTDASDGVVTGILSQQHSDTEWYSVAYFSKTIASAECNYKIHNKEMLAIICSLKQWRPELEGTHSQFQIYTDHKALEYFMTTKQLTGRQAQWAEALSEYYFTIMYWLSKQNTKADVLTQWEQETDLQDEVKAEYQTCAFLSRDQVDPWVLKDLRINVKEVDLALMKELLIDEPLGLINKILQTNWTAESLQALWAQAEERDPELMLEDGLLLYNERLVVPETDHLCTDLIKKAHEQVSTAHLRQDKTYQLLRARYYWWGMLVNVQRFICNCHQCKWADISWDKTPESLHSLLISDQPWQHVTMDYKSQPRDKHEFDNIFIVVNCLSKQSICTLCHKTVTAEDMTKMYLQHIYWYYGAPESIVSDRGPQFIFYFWKEFCHILSIKLKLFTAFHLQTDGQTEIMNQYLN